MGRDGGGPGSCGLFPGQVTSCEARGLSSVGDVGGTRLSPQKPLGPGSAECQRGCLPAAAAGGGEGAGNGRRLRQRRYRVRGAAKRRRYPRQPGAVAAVRLERGGAGTVQAGWGPAGRVAEMLAARPTGVGSSKGAVAEGRWASWI